jgi:transposase
LIPDFLWHGAEAYGFRGEVWTCARIAKVLEEEFGVSYHKGHVARLLKEVRWAPQIPITRAVQRDEEAIERWQKEVWPELKKRAHREHRTLVFVDEAGFYLLPGVVRTYGPEGLRPVIYEWQTKDHLSVMGGMTLRGKLYTLVRQEPLSGLHTVAFLGHLLRQTRGKLLVTWDGSPIHRRSEVKEFLSTGEAQRIHVEALPAYAPDLNPREWVWQHLKNVEMRNLVCLDLEELHAEFHLAVARLRQKAYLMKSFFAGAGLEL